MKHVFAAGLVLAALVTVFNFDIVMPVPRAGASLLTRTFSKIMPFEAKAAYAESCLNDLRVRQGRVRIAVSVAAVRLDEIDRELEAVDHRRQQSVVRLEALVNGSTPNEERIGAEVDRHDRLKSRIDDLLEARAKLAATLDSLVTAESHASDRVTKASHRLELVRLDHERNDARELAASLSNPEIRNGAIGSSPFTDVVKELEHHERVRDEYYQRYGPHIDPDVDPADSTSLDRAREILSNG